jgi:hypothetical protein
VVLKIRVFKNYYRLIDAIANGEVDFSRCGPDAYVLATRRNAGIRLLARHGDLDESMIIARKDLEIQTLDGLRKLVEERKKMGAKVRLAFGDSISGSGRFRIQEALVSVGIYADDVHWEYLGRHDEVAKAVLSGKLDVGGLKGAVYEKFFGKKGSHRGAVTLISYGTQEEVFSGPGKPWAARAGLDKLVVDEKNVFEVLRKCLCEFTQERYEGFWERHAVDVDIEYRKNPPEDWGLPIVQAEENDYSKTREIQESSWKFFNALADRLIESSEIRGLIDSRRLGSGASRAEMKARVQKVLDDLEMLDHDILVLRHFKQMTTSETAQVLGIEQSEAHDRYLRASEGIQKALSNPDEEP